MALFLPLIAKGIYSGLIATIGTSAIKICKTMSRLYTCDNSRLINSMRGLDIDRKIKYIDSILKMDEMQPYLTNENNPLKLCYTYVIQSMNAVNDILNMIEIKINRHNAKWVKNWRKLNIDNEIDALKLEADILEKRFYDFKKTFMLLTNNK